MKRGKPEGTKREEIKRRAGEVYRKANELYKRTGFGREGRLNDPKLKKLLRSVLGLSLQAQADAERGDFEAGYDAEARAQSQWEKATQLRTSEQSSRNASQPRKKAWAAELAHELAATHSRFSTAWESLEETELGEVGFYAGYEVYIDGDHLCATNARTGESERPIKRDTFRTSYFSPARTGKL